MIARAAREEAVREAWAFDKVHGSLALLEKLVNGDWNASDFLFVPPGATVRAALDDAIVTAV